jgi:hypothetical protein
MPHRLTHLAVMTAGAKQITEAALKLPEQEPCRWRQPC